MKNQKGPDFLIVGCERSGTHWVTALLNSHPGVACFPAIAFRKESGEYSNDFGEIHLFNTLASLESDNKDKFVRPISNYLTTHHKYFADLVPYEEKVPKEELYEKFIQRYNELCNSKRGMKKLVGEKTASYIFHLDFIDSFYPMIKKLCIIRNPKDQIVSWHFNDIRKGRKTEMTISDEFILDYCRKRIIKEYESLLTYKGKVHCFTYESLTNNTKEVISGILKYLEVQVGEELIEYMTDNASFQKLTAIDSGITSRTRGEESIKSHYRKGIVGDWQNYLTIKQTKLVDQILLNLRIKVFDKHNLSKDNII